MAKGTKKNAATAQQGAAGVTVTPPTRRAPAPITTEQIRKRAYEIYLRRNGGPGDPASDWLAAERELLAERR